MGRRRFRSRLSSIAWVGVVAALLSSSLAAVPAQAVFRGATVIDPSDLPGLDFDPPVREIEIPTGDFSNLPPGPSSPDWGSWPGSIVPGGPSGPSGPGQGGGRLGDPVTGPRFDPTGRSVLERTERSTTWEGDAGSKVTRLYSHDVNFRRDGAWNPIDHGLDAQPGGGHGNRSGPLGVHFAPRANAGSILRVSDNGWSVGFAPQGAGNVAGTTEGSMITYPGALSGSDLIYFVTDAGVKQLIKLDAAPEGTGPITYRSTLNLVGVVARIANDTIELVRPDGTVVGTIPDGFASDSSGRAPEQPAQASVDVSLIDDGGRPTVELTLDGAWARSPERVYPIYIDPIYQAGRAEMSGDAYVSSGWPNDTFNGDRQINTSVIPNRYESRVGHGFGIEVNSFFHYATSALNGKTINSATWNGYIYEAGGASPWRPFAIWPTSEPWGESTVTYNTRPNHRADKISATPAGLGWTGWNVTDWVKRWTTLDATQQWPNYGFTLDTAGDTGPYYAFAADEASGSGLDSYIEVNYSDTAPPIPLGFSTPISPAASTTITTDRPTFTSTAVTSTTANPVKYLYRITTGDDAETGQVLNSGWMTTPGWDVPAGSLQDGGTYSWRVYADDGAQRSVSVPQKFKLNLRLGAGSVSPVDGVGAFSVNLATGNVAAAASSPTFSTVGGPIGMSYTYNSLGQKVTGLTGEYFANTTLTGPSVLVRRDSGVNFDWGPTSPGPSVPEDNFSVRWTGSITAPTKASGYSIGARSDDGIRIWVGGKLVLDKWVNQAFPASPVYGSTSDFSANLLPHVKTSALGG